MRNHILRTIAFAILSLGLAAAASAQTGHTCSLRNVAGAWGYTDTGTLFRPTGPVPFVFVGTFTTDAAGNFMGTQISNVGGAVAQDTLRGEITLDPGCTGLLTVGIYDPAENLLRTAIWALVYVDDAREIRGVFKSLVLSDGTIVPAIGSSDSKRLSRNHGEEQ